VKASHGYHPRHGRRYDSGRTGAGAPIRGTLGIRPAHPQRGFPATVSTTNEHPKILWETNLILWLKDYQLAC
jgi:hypothetical protein